VYRIWFDARAELSQAEELRAAAALQRRRIRNPPRQVEIGYE